MIIKWWQLKKGECSAKYREELRQALRSNEELPDERESTAGVVRETASWCRKCLV